MLVAELATLAGTDEGVANFTSGKRRKKQLGVQVAHDMAQKWSIFKVGTADMLPGQSNAWAYVLKGRTSVDEQPSDFEQLAMQRSCSLVLEVGEIAALPPSHSGFTGDHWLTACICKPARTGTHAGRSSKLSEPVQLGHIVIGWGMLHLGAVRLYQQLEDATCVVQGQSEEGDEHAELFAMLMVTTLQLYESQWEVIRLEAGLKGIKGGSFMAHLGKPDGVACRDYHMECSHWADEVSNLHQFTPTCTFHQRHIPTCKETDSASASASARRNCPVQSPCGSPLSWRLRPETSPFFLTSSRLSEI